MKERPILFNGEMVRAILDGRKSVTRRVVKYDAGTGGVKLVRLPRVGRFIYLDHVIPGLGWIPAGGAPVEPWPAERIGEACPYGEPGDRLWVRETFAEVHPCAISEGRFSKPGKAGIPGPPGVSYRVVYRADGEVPDVEHRPRHPYRVVADGLNPSATERHVWTPSIHMPRWASRITLEVTDVRVERVQDISEEDAKAEGVTTDVVDGTVNGEPARVCPMTHRRAFAWLWDHINAKRGSGWASNPWVWVVSFRRLP